VTAAPALTLPWADRADAHCFGCAPANPAGLGLRFVPDGDGLAADLCLDRRYESYPGVLHGGIVALVCDEVMGNLVVLRHGRPAVTTSLRMRYVGIVAVGARYRCSATLAAPTHTGTIAGRAEVRDADGALMATATATYHPLPADSLPADPLPADPLPAARREDPS
jgi:acyl-coenzyme A thioesterase PaaI-like protein